MVTSKPLLELQAMQSAFATGAFKFFQTNKDTHNFKVAKTLFSPFLKKPFQLLQILIPKKLFFERVHSTAQKFQDDGTFRDERYYESHLARLKFGKNLQY